MGRRSMRRRVGQRSASMRHGAHLRQPIHHPRLRALFALDQFVLHLFAVLERTEAVALDLRVVDEDVATIRAEDEAEPLLGVEPFNLATLRHDGSPETI